MLGAAAAILLCLLLSEVNGLTAVAKCLPGYEWMFSSIGQSPCDVGVELASVCYTSTYQLNPLRPGYSYYPAPYPADDNSCLCSSVYYSVLSACGYCQGETILPWSTYITNCTYVYVIQFPRTIPTGVRVPAYAFQDVSLYNQFNVSLANSMRGVESSRAPPSSTPIPTSSPSSSSSSGGTTATITTTANASANSPAVIGGIVVGGLVGVGLIAALITFLVFRSKQKSRSQSYNSGFQQSPNMAVSPDTPGSLSHSGIGPNTNDENIYPDPNIYDANRRHSPQLAENSTQTPPQTVPNAGGRYSGMPEL